VQSHWLEGDPAQPRPPASRLIGRNSDWPHLYNRDVISMPDKWEYPWYAAWDLAFHMIPFARIDPEFAKEQLLLFLREWYMHPNGQIPAYEWAFGDVNPPVHAWAALRVFECDGSRDYDFLARVFPRLLLNFTWWVNRKDAAGNHAFSGGFLGLDNIGPIDRSAALPVTGRLEQSDGTAWMAIYALNPWEMALILAEHERSHEDLATRFFERFAYIAAAMRERGLWDEADGFFYDVLRRPDGQAVPLRVRSRVGLRPLCATTTLGAATLKRLPEFAERFAWFRANRPQHCAVIGRTCVTVTGAVCSPWSPPSSCRGSWPRCWRRSSCPGTACGRCPGGTGPSRSRCTSPGRRARSTTSPGGPPAGCSAATPTGAGRSGSRSTTCSSRRCAASRGSSATTCSSSTPPGPARSTR
jgi:hypothetical protein